MRRRGREWPRYLYMYIYIYIYIWLDLDFHPLCRWDRWKARGRGGEKRKERRATRGGSGGEFAMRADWPRDLTLCKRLQPIIRSLPLFRILCPLCTPTPMRGRECTSCIHSAKRPCCMDFRCCSACRNRRYTIGRRWCVWTVVWLSSFTAFNSLPRYLVEIIMPHVARRMGWIGSRNWQFAYQRNYESLNARMAVKSALCVYLFHVYVLFYVYRYVLE